MIQQPSSEKLDSTWGKFSTKTAAETVQAKLEDAGIDPEKITLETEDFSTPIKLEDTQAIANLKGGAITGGVMGFLVGLSISLILTNFSSLRVAALKNFQTIHYFAPIMGGIVGAVGMSLISGITGANVPKGNTKISNSHESKRYLVVVKGTADETSLARDTIAQQGGLVEEADRR